MLFIFILLIILAIFITKPNFLDVIIITFLGYLSLISTNAADYNSYNNIYYAISSHELYETGYGWYLINSWARTQGLQYNQLKALLTILGLLLTVYTIHQLIGKNYNLTWGLYLLYPSLINVVQIRFFIAMSIVLFGLTFLSKGTIKGNLLYALIVVAAFTIHTSAAFYLIFLLVPIVEKKERLFSELIFMVAICLVPLKNNLQQIVGIFANERQLTYFDSSKSLIVQLILIGVIISIWIITNRLNKIIQRDIEDRKVKAGVRFIKNINTCMLLLIPLITISAELGRVERISWILVYAIIGMIVDKRKVIIGEKIKISPRFLGISIGMFGFFIMILYLAPDAFRTIF